VRKIKQLSLFSSSVVRIPYKNKKPHSFIYSSSSINISVFSFLIDLLKTAKIKNNFLKNFLKGSDYPKTLAIALSLSLLATLLIMGGALFAFLYWRKSKLNRSGASSQNQSIIRSLGNRFSGTAYKATPPVRLDNIPPASNYVNSNAFELQHYDNQTFDDHFDGYQNFTDFSGR